MNYNRPIAEKVATALVKAGINKEQSDHIIETFAEVYYWKERAKDSRDRFSNGMKEIYNEGGIEPGADEAEIDLAPKSKVARAAAEKAGLEVIEISLTEFESEDLAGTPVVAAPSVSDEPEDIMSLISEE